MQGRKEGRHGRGCQCPVRVICPPNTLPLNPKVGKVTPQFTFSPSMYFSPSSAPYLPYCQYNDPFLFYCSGLPTHSPCNTCPLHRPCGQPFSLQLPWSLHHLAFPNLTRLPLQSTITFTTLVPSAAETKYRGRENFLAKLKLFWVIFMSAVERR